MMHLELYINTKLRDEIPVTLETWEQEAKELRNRFRFEIRDCIQWRIILVIRSRALQQT